MPLVKVRETSYKKACYVQALHFRAGWTYQRIAENQNIRLSTVDNIYNAAAMPKKHKGRPVLINASTHR